MVVVMWCEVYFKSNGVNVYHTASFCSLDGSLYAGLCVLIAYTPYACVLQLLLGIQSSDNCNRMLMTFLAHLPLLIIQCLLYRLVSLSFKSPLAVCLSWSLLRDTHTHTHTFTHWQNELCLMAHRWALFRNRVVDCVCCVVYLFTRIAIYITWRL